LNNNTNRSNARQKAVRLLLLATTTAITLFAGIWSFSRSQAAGFYQPLPKPEVHMGSQGEISVAPPVEVKPVSAESLGNQSNPVDAAQATEGAVQTAGGVTVELRNIRRDAQYLWVNVCYQLPSDADWLPGNSPSDVVLSVQGREIQISGGKLIEYRISTTGRKTHRCDDLRFPVSASQDLTEFTLILKRLVTSIPERPDCNKAQEKLNAARTGIIIQCLEGESTFGYEVLKMPETMTDAQARTVVAEALSDIVRGPWVFSTGLK